MKKIYNRPAQRVFRTKLTRIICTSDNKGWDVMSPGEKNAQAPFLGHAGARSYGDWDDNSDEE